MVEIPLRTVRVAFKPADEAAAALRATVEAVAKHLHFSDERALGQVLGRCAKVLPLLISTQTLRGVVVQSQAATVPIMLDYELDPAAPDELGVGELELLEAQVGDLGLLFLVDDEHLAAAYGAAVLPQVSTETVVLSVKGLTPSAE